MDSRHGTLLHALLRVTTSDIAALCHAQQHRVVHDSPARLPAPLRHAALNDVHALAQVYRGRLAFTSGPKSPDMAAAEKVSARTLWQMGLTVYFNDITPYVPGLDGMLRQIETELGVRAGCARCGAFASPPGDGLACHYDAEEVISIQLRGRKRFYLAPVSELPQPYGMQYSPGCAPYDELYPQVAQRFPDWHLASFETVDMQPGSVLFMPRGTWHRSEAVDESLAVSIILRPPAMLDSALEQLRLLLLQDPRWREPLYGLQRDAAANTAIAARLAELPAIAATLQAENILRHNSSEPKRIARIDAHSRFQTNPIARIESQTKAASQSIVSLLLKTIDDQHGERVTARLDIAPAAAKVFEWLAARPGPFCAAEVAAHFPAFPLSEHLEILRAAANGQLLKLLSFPALASPAPDSLRSAR